MTQTTTSRSPTAEDRAAVGELRRLRLKAGRSQSWIAEQLGISTQQWGKYERGINRVPTGRFNMAKAILEGAIMGKEPALVLAEQVAPAYRAGVTGDADLATAVQTAIATIETELEKLRRCL